LTITSANVDQIITLFYGQSPEKTLYVTITWSDPHFNYVVTLPWEIQKSTISAEHLLIQSQSRFYLKLLTKLNNIMTINATKI